ncbi:unnamed protein product [Litomosoides sigmodontis]|uniref:Uncharacterized protein n=1 Tax=Litomosoides sigmodontis TaxID=42156 RepID=A0A3P6SRF8_LITSI|nr:unnamed protein product [Litomosoides sigmodontis]
MNKKKSTWRSEHEVPLVRSASYGRTVKYDESSKLSGGNDESDSEESLNIPTARNISNQTEITVNACSPETAEQALTAHELSREALEFSRSSVGHLLLANRGKFLDARSAKTPLLEKASSLQQPNSNFSMSGQESKNVNFCPASVLLKSANTSFSSVSGKHHELLHKRKFVVLPPTPSFISNSSGKHSASRSKGSISPQSSTTSKDKKGYFAPLPNKPERNGCLFYACFYKRKKIFRYFTPNEDELSNTKLPFRVPSLVTVTQESDDTKSCSVRRPSKWFKKSTFTNQSKSEPQGQSINLISYIFATHIVIPISSDRSKSFSSNARVMQQTSESKINKASSVSSTSIKNKTKVQLTIDLQVKNKEGQLSEKHSLKAERILVKGREVYHKKDSYLL